MEEEAQITILKVLKAIKKIVDISPRSKFDLEEARKRFPKNPIVVTSEAIRSVGVDLLVQRTMSECGVNFNELESILGKLEEEGFILLSHFINDQVGGDSSVFRVIPTPDFQKKVLEYETGTEHLVEDEVETLVDEIKDLMIDVGRGKKVIDDVNSEYKSIYRKLDNLLKKKGVKHDNPHSDLREYYHYWKKNFPHYSERDAYVIGLYENPIPLSPHVDAAKDVYVDEARIAELKALQGVTHDVTRLVRYCEELNDNFSRKNYLSVSMLVRAIKDHVPPIFGKVNFLEVAAQHGGKSFKETASRLQGSLKSIADQQLHEQIRQKEVLPTKTQVNFSQDLDVVLGEICRLLKK